MQVFRPIGPFVMRSHGHVDVPLPVIR